MSSPHDTAIADLAKILLIKQVKSDIIRQALTYICSQFSFDSGMVYEIDQANDFYLQERIFSQTKPLRESFSIDDISPECRCQLAESLLFYSEPTQDNSECGNELRDFFSAYSLAASTVVDENTRIFSIILFTRSHAKEVFSAEELKTLTVLISMLEKYAALRIQRNRLSFAQVSLESILDHTGIDIYVNDFHTHDILYVNKSMAAPYGGQERFMADKCWRVLFPSQSGPCEFCPQKNIIDDDGNPTKTYSWDYQRAFDGSWFRVFSSAFRWIDGRLAHVVSSANITDNKRNAELVEYLANYDVLTKLPNRRKLVADCEKRIDNAGADTKGFVLFFDIDGFKAINDTLGHDSGDEFLVQLGDFFSGIPLLKDMMYRNGGDEFVALMGSGLSEATIRYLASFIHERFKKPWLLKKGEIMCNTSIGAACFPADGTTAEALLHKADQAMYYVKKNGGGTLVFAHEIPPSDNA